MNSDTIFLVGIILLAITMITYIFEPFGKPLNAWWMLLAFIGAILSIYSIYKLSITKRENNKKEEKKDEYLA